MKGNGLNRRSFFSRSMKAGIGAFILANLPFVSVNAKTKIKGKIDLKIHPDAVKRNKQGSKK